MVAVLPTVQAVVYGNCHLLATVVAAGAAVVEVGLGALFHTDENLLQFLFGRGLDKLPRRCTAVLVSALIDAGLPVVVDGLFQFLERSLAALVAARLPQLLPVPCPAFHKRLQFVQGHVVVRRSAAPVAALLAVQAVHEPVVGLDPGRKRTVKAGQVLEYGRLPFYLAGLGGNARHKALGSPHEAARRGVQDGPLGGRVFVGRLGERRQVYALLLEVEVQILHRHIVVAAAVLIELAPLGKTGGYDRNLTVPVGGVEVTDAFDRMRHGAVPLGKVFNELGPVYFDEADERRAGLGNHNRRVFPLYLFHVSFGRQFCAESDVKDCLHADGLEPAVQLQVPALKVDGNGGCDDGNHRRAGLEVIKESLHVINAGTGPVHAGVNAGSAADAEVVVHGHMVARSIVAHLDGTHADAAVTIAAFLRVNVHDRAEMFGIGVLVHNSHLKATKKQRLRRAVCSISCLNYNTLPGKINRSRKKYLPYSGRTSRCPAQSAAGWRKSARPKSLPALRASGFHPGCRHLPGQRP